MLLMFARGWHIISILIGCHQKVLPNNIKMLIDSLVFSLFVYGLPVWVLHYMGNCLTILLVYTIVGHLIYVYMTMCHITDLLLVGSLLTLLFRITHLLLCICSTGVITACC